MDPEERVRHRTVEQVGNVPVPQFREQIVEVVTVVLLERISWCVSSENYQTRVLLHLISRIPLAASSTSRVS